MKIVIDDKIPFIQGVFEPYAEVVYASGRSISAEMVVNADVLITRTRTRCDKKLLEGSKVKFIATATIGYDHIDAAYCAQNNITWVSAPGCNADAVVQYVFSALGHLAMENGFNLSDKVLGIVGVGNVGKRVAAFAQRLGIKILLNDPPRADVEGNKGFVSLEEIRRKADIISFHTPLTKEGKYATYHLLDDGFFEGIHKPIVINAARGEVCSNVALKKACKRGLLTSLILDCWEHEPMIDTGLLDMADITTFHIAGYSMEGKANATTAVVRAVSQFFALGMDDWSVKLPEVSHANDCKSDLLEQVVRSYPIYDDVNALKQNPHKFEELRGNYHFRRQPDCL